MMFSQLYIVAQQRTTDMTSFFSRARESTFPPPLSDAGKLRMGKTFDLINILTNKNHSDPPDFLDAMIVDGAAVVHFLPITNIVTFDDYADQICIPHILQQLQNCKRVDIVWDTSYIPL